MFKELKKKSIISRYDIVKCITERSKQLECGSRTVVVKENMITYKQIAIEELKMEFGSVKRINNLLGDYIVKRLKSNYGNILISAHYYYVDNGSINENFIHQVVTIFNDDSRIDGLVRGPMFDIECIVKSEKMIFTGTKKCLCENISCMCKNIFFDKNTFIIYFGNHIKTTPEEYFPQFHILNALKRMVFSNKMTLVVAKYILLMTYKNCFFELSLLDIILFN